MSSRSRKDRRKDGERNHEVMLGGVGSIRSSLAKLSALRVELAKSKGSLWDKVVKKAGKSQKKGRT